MDTDNSGVGAGMGGGREWGNKDTYVIPLSIKKLFLKGSLLGSTLADPDGQQALNDQRTE